MNRRLIILRHGRTEWNAQRRYQGQADPPLDELGLRQAAEVAPLIAAMQPDVIVTSDLIRAVCTAGFVADAVGLAPIEDAGLRERHLGHWQGLTRAEVQAAYPEEYAEWEAGLDVHRRGGETRAAVAERAVRVLDSVSQYDCAVLISHGATAMCLTSAMLGLPQTPSLIGALANCHWTELRDEGAGWRLRAHNAGAPGEVIPAVAPEAESADADA